MSLSTNRHKKNNKKIVAIIVVIISAVVVTAAIWYLLQSKQSEDSTNKDTTSSSKPQTGDNTASNVDDKQDFLDDNKDKPNQNTPGPVTPTPLINFTATTSDETVIIKTDLSTIPSGTCTLSVSGSSLLVTKTAPVIYSPEFSSCAGFSIPKSEVNAQTWTIKLDVKTPDTILTKTINYIP